MLPLEDRHADRARRIVANGSEVAANPGPSLGAATVHYRNYMQVRNRLNDDDLKRLEGQLEAVEADVQGSNSLAEAPDGSGRTMAGVGVINTRVVPAGIELPEGGNGGGTSLKNVDGWGANESPASYVETSDTNLGGEALQTQDAGSDLKASAKGAKESRKEGSTATDDNVGATGAKKS